MDGYLTYDEYQAMGGTLDEKEFSGAEIYAETLLDSMTLGRIKNDKSEKPDGYEKAVKAAMFIIVNRVKDIRAAFQASATGSNVTSYSNGTDSFGFGGTASNAAANNPALAATYDEVATLLPIELISACVAYNFAQ